MRFLIPPSVIDCNAFRNGALLSKNAERERSLRQK
jgi:hypothetical protein